jgi:hypothetical protein
MRNTLIAGVLIASGIGAGLTAVWPKPPVDYQPAVLAEGEILAEGGRHCTDIQDDWLKKICLGSSHPTAWKMSLIFRTCGEKTAHLLINPHDTIGLALQDIERWRCEGQYADINGLELSDWPRSSRGRVTDSAWGNLRLHWQSNGAARPLAFSRAVAHVVNFSLSK